MDTVIPHAPQELAAAILIGEGYRPYKELSDQDRVTILIRHNHMGARERLAELLNDFDLLLGKPAVQFPRDLWNRLGGPSELEEARREGAWPYAHSPQSPAVPQEADSSSANFADADKDNKGPQPTEPPTEQRGQAAGAQSEASVPKTATEQPSAELMEDERLLVEENPSASATRQAAPTTFSPQPTGSSPPSPKAAKHEWIPRRRGELAILQYLTRSGRGRVLKAELRPDRLGVSHRTINMGVVRLLVNRILTKRGPWLYLTSGDHDL